MSNCDPAANTAAEPSIRADIAAVLPPIFLAYLPKSIVITVPMMLYGPPMVIPTKNMET
jgi:hypothetical protein